MSEWWTYTPRDFLMFSPGSHARLLEQYNLDAWPLHGVMLVVGGLLVAAALTSAPRAARWLAFVLAGTWAWVGWEFLWSRFAEINTLAGVLAAAFWVQALLIAALGTHPPQSPARPSRGAQLAGAAVIAAALLLWPLSAPLTGRSWTQAEFFGLVPEPTALATLGWLLAVRPPRARWQAVIPAVTMALGLVMLWLLYGPDAAGAG